MYSRCERESKPAWSGMNRPLFQNRTIQSTANKMRIAISIRLHDRCGWATGFGERLSCQRQINQVATARPRKPSQIGQMLRKTFIVCSPAVAGLPGPGNLGVEASTTERQLDPAIDASQLRSVRSVVPSVISASQSAGGARSLK